MKTLEERLTSYRASFLEKVKRTNWDDEDEYSYKRRGRKPKLMTKFESKPRTKGEKQAWKQQKLNNKYNWL